MPKGSTTQRIIGETQNASFEDRGTALREQRSTNNPLATSESWDVSLLLLKRLLRPTVCVSLSSPFSCSLLSSAGFGHLGSRGAEHTQRGAGWFPAAACGQSLSGGVWRTKVRPHTCLCTQTDALMISFSSSSSFHFFIIISPSFLNFLL